jgi:tetratricopeptide (TPR) repeat protein
LDEGNMDEALERTRESAQLADAKLRQDKHAGVLDQWQYAAILWRQHSREAVEESRITYDLARKYWNDQSNPDLLATRSFRAVVLADLQGNAQSALSELRAVREEQMRLFGTRAYTFVVRTNERIGLVSLMMGDPASAIASYHEALRGETEQIGGADAVEIARNRMKLGEALLAARRFNEAEKELRDAREMRKRLNQPPSPELALLLVAVLTHDGRLAEAELTLAPLLEQPPASPRDLAAFKRRLGQLRSAQGRPGEAVSILREAEKLYEKTETPDRVAEAIATLGSAQLAAGNATDALATLSRSDKVLEKVHPQGSPDHADLLIDIARAQLILGHPADAVTAAARAEEFWKQFDAQNRQAGLAQLWHARALLAQGDQYQAFETGERALAVLDKAALPVDGPLLTQIRRELRVPAHRP